MDGFIAIQDVKEILDTDSLDQYLEDNKLQMYESHVLDKDGNDIVIGYMFGEPWVGQCLFMEGSRFKTEEEAVLDWYKKNFKNKK